MTGVTDPEGGGKMGGMSVGASVTDTPGGGMEMANESGGVLDGGDWGGGC